jgi:hypothetical protein
MARHGENGAFYTTDDLIRMARLENFGQFSAMLERVFVKYKQLDAENKQLKTLAKQLQAELEAKTSGMVIEKLL